MAGSRVQFSSTLQFWNAKSKECRIPPFPPASLAASIGANGDVHQQVGSLSSRSGNKQYNCHSLNIGKFRQSSPNKRLHCENLALLGLKPSEIAKRSISYQQPSQVQYETLYRRNFSNPSPLRLPSKPTGSAPLRVSSSPLDISTCIDPASPVTSGGSDLDITEFSYSTSWSQPEIQPLQWSTPQHSPIIRNSVLYGESLSSLNLLPLSSSQSGSVSSRYSFSYRDFETHTPVLEVLSPIPLRPWRPSCELWRLSDYMEYYGGNGSLHIDSHGRVFDDEDRYNTFLHEEEDKNTRMEKEMTAVVSEARELVVTVTEVEPEQEEEQTMTGDDTVLRYAESNESMESLKDSMEDENDEVWGRIDNVETMDASENERWWESGNDVASTECLRIAVSKILRVTNPDVTNLRESLDSFGYVKHHTTPETSSIDLSILADISFEESNIDPILTSLEPIPLPVIHERGFTKPLTKPSRKRKSEISPPPRRALCERIIQPVHTKVSSPIRSSTPIAQVRNRFPIDDSPKSQPKTENRPLTKKQRTVKRNICMGQGTESGSGSSLKKPFRKALMSLSLRKYNMINSSSERLMKIDSNQKENRPIKGTDYKAKKSKRTSIEGFWGSLLHGI
ncbi:hypothetical protein BJ508DRAFT_356899 [Ascobolus immersus RN42]|uniref:Uncharacterized protein n=1 Tax=Ascobolus immersus RN42 TaxID=1160509 RepID=A0A3N4IPN8_ASCIM|nr:hypothetical protein BJ508DRAFT_356899 [Ascobolus immersus RN42]